MTLDVASQVLLATLMITASVVFLAYRAFAIHYSWDVGEWHRGIGSILAGLFGHVFALGAILRHVPDASVVWRLPLLTVGGLLAGFALMGMFRARAQLIATRLWFVAFVGLATALAA